MKLYLRSSIFPSGLHYLCRAWLQITGFSSPSLLSPHSHRLLTRKTKQYDWGKGKQRLHQQLPVTSKVVTGVLPIHISRPAGRFGMRMLMSKHYPWTTVARVLLGERHKSSSWVTRWRSAQPWSALSRVCCVSLYPQTEKSVLSKPVSDQSGRTANIL